MLGICNRFFTTMTPILPRNDPKPLRKQAETAMARDCEIDPLRSVTYFYNTVTR